MCGGVVESALLLQLEALAEDHMNDVVTNVAALATGLIGFYVKVLDSFLKCNNWCTVNNVPGFYRHERFQGSQSGPLTDNHS